jgi:alpha-tubulin suppressor-like RCC1 family protein
LLLTDGTNCSLERADDPACKRCVRQISFGFEHTCVLLYDGSIECTGYGFTGELGLGYATTEYRGHLAAATALTGIPISSVGTGEEFTCVLAAPSEGNKVLCFGLDWGGNLGDGMNTSSRSKYGSIVPVVVKGLKQSPPITQLAVGLYWACVLYGAAAAATADAHVQCWGKDIGLIATDIKGMADVTAISLGALTLCTLRKNRTVTCRNDMRFPSDYVIGLENVVSVSVGNAVASVGNAFRGRPAVACATVHPADSTVSLWCWGKNAYAQLSYRSEPWKVSGLPGDIVQFVVGRYHACVLVNHAETSKGEVYCWGVNGYGQLGQGQLPGNSSESSFKPLLVKGLSRHSVSALFGGYDSTCAVTATQQVLCWGNNYFGQLGIGTTSNSGRKWEKISLPTAMLGLCA